MNCKVIYPTTEIMKGYFLAYYSYLLKGFKDLGCSIEYDKKLNTESINKGFFHILAIDIYLNNKKYRIYYDWSDFQLGFKREIRLNEFYFKVECNLGHIYRYGIYPIGHGVTYCDEYFNNLEMLRELRKKKNYKYNIMFKGRATSPCMGKESERIKVIKILEKHPEFNSSLLVLYYTVNRPNYKPVKNKTDYLQFLKEVAHSKINLLLPGVGEFTWRISETLGIGACGLMPKLSSILPGNPKNCWIEVERDYSDLVSKIDYYLKHDEEREIIAKNGLKYFEEWLSPKAQASYILRVLEK
ncbi:hypothetical protein DRN69_02455 [Candidatus Pacearchaeota archaeon]|nr:MAG: hypothetical protein DRN69_02455 [Candidatus Pacearchaeota archaeon]